MATPTTDHEHLGNLGLIHMNARVQDPVIGRFLSAEHCNAGGSLARSDFTFFTNSQIVGGREQPSYELIPHDDGTADSGPCCSS